MFVKRRFYGLTKAPLNRAIASIAGLGFLLLGYDQGVMGGLLTLPAFINTFPELDVLSPIPEVKSRAAQVQGVSISIYEIGCLAGALSTLWLGETYGRRKMIFTGASIMIVGATLQAASFSLAQLIAGRIVTGFGNGFVTATVPVWQSECAKPEERGYLIMIEGALITGGIMLSYWIDFAFYFAPGDISWRFPIAFQIVFCLGLIAFVLPLPESPRWLIKKGNYYEAAIVFAALNGTVPDDPAVLAQIEEIKATLPLIETSAVKEIFTQGKQKHFWRASLALWVQIMQQITGINLITYYAATIYETSIGLSPLNSKILAACNGTEYFLASWIAVYTIERLGRRKLMLVGATGQSISMLLLTVMTYLAAKKDALPYPGQDNAQAGIVAAVLLFAFNTFFAIGWLGMGWLIPSEITALRIRGPAAGIATAGNWVFNFMVVLITPIAFDTIGYYTYTIFFALNFCLIPVVYFLYPETSRRSLEEIDLIFEDADPWKPWQVVKIARDLPYRNERGEGIESEGSGEIRLRLAGKESRGEKDVGIEDVKVGE